MIKLTYKQLRKPEFLLVTQRIYQSRMAARSAARVMAVLEDLQKELERTNKEFDKMAAKHMKKTEDNHAYEAKTEADQKHVDKFLDKEVTLKHEPINLQELFHVELSPSDIKTLDGFINVR